MSRVNIKDINPGNVLDVADVGDTIDSWVSATTPTGNAAVDGGIGSDNIRDEGIDRRMFLLRDVVTTGGSTESNAGTNTSGQTESSGWDYIVQGGRCDGQWGIYNPNTSTSSTDTIIGPLTYSSADNHMMIIRYSLDIAEAPSFTKAIGDYWGSGGYSKSWNMKTKIQTRLVWIESSSRPTNSSIWNVMPVTRRVIQMGPFGFQAPIAESDDQLGLPNLDTSTYNHWLNSPDDDNYSQAAGIFADKTRLRGNICASHVFDSVNMMSNAGNFPSSGSAGTHRRTGYHTSGFTTTNTTTLWIGLQVRVDGWDDNDSAKVAINNASLIARTFVR
mgnify:CR=1 FL=1|tara:strand:+ start:23573 stop:24565 length:993 start_codon:yes stop_codon:yes gene_type:complete